MKRWVGIGLGIIVSAGIFIALIGSDLEAVKQELANASYIYAIPFILLHVLGTFTRSLRWHTLLNGTMNRQHSFQIISVGYFLSSVLPLRLGDFTRAWMTTRLTPPVAGFTSLSTIIIERLMDLLAVIGLMGLTLVFIDVPQQVTTAGIFMGIMAIIGFAALGFMAARPRIAFAILNYVLKLLPFLERFDLQERLGYFLEGIQPLGTPKVTIQALLWTVISWGISVAGGYVILYTLFDDPTFGAALILTLLTALSIALPAVPGNLGPFEGATVGALWIAGLISTVTAPGNAAGVALGTLLHALSLGTYVLLGLYGLFMEHASVQQLREGTRDFIEHEHQSHPSHITQESLT